MSGEPVEPLVNAASSGSHHHPRVPALTRSQDVRLRAASSVSQRELRLAEAERAFLLGSMGAAGGEDFFG